MSKKKEMFKTRRWRVEDIPQIIACQKAAYPNFPPDFYYEERHLQMSLAAFPEGQFLVIYQKQVVGYATSVIVQLDDESPYFYTDDEMTGISTFSTHNPSGDTLYGADIAVHPDFRGQGVSKLLYKRRKRILKRYNLRRMVAYGRIPGYQNYADEMTPEEYVEKVTQGELRDSSLNAHLSGGYRVRRVMLDFFWDAASLNYSTFLEMPNPQFRAEQRLIAAAPIHRITRKIRVCAAQYQMRRLTSWEEFEQSIDFFITIADTYHCHFLLFPQYFTAPLFSLIPQKGDDRQAIRELASYAPRYKKLLMERATQYGVYIIGGTQPILREGKLYNTAHLFTPTGNIYTQDKLHLTPWERETLQIEPGHEMRLFDTPLGRIALQIGYDIEFPELSRLLTLAGAEVIFVPYSANQKKAYHRVRYAAQACAVMNYVYVVMAGTVGNLPMIKSYLVNYGQAAMLSPSDVSFPLGGVIDEAEPNTETVVVADLDLTTLMQQRELGAVRSLYERRNDLYEVRAKIPVKVMRVD